MTNLLNIEQAAAILNISVSTLYKWVEQYKITSYKINGNVRFKQEHLENWIENHKVKEVKKIA